MTNFPFSSFQIRWYILNRIPACPCTASPSIDNVTLLLTHISYGGFFFCQMTPGHKRLNIEDGMMERCEQLPWNRQE